MEVRLSQRKRNRPIRLNKNDASMVRWIGNGRPSNRVSEQDCRARLKLNSVKMFTG